MADADSTPGLRVWVIECRSGDGGDWWIAGVEYTRRIARGWARAWGQNSDNRVFRVRRYIPAPQGQDA
jgi:hypothetical protein